MNPSLLTLRPAERLRCELLLRALDDHKDWPAAIKAARAAERFVMDRDSEIVVEMTIKPDLSSLLGAVVLGDEVEDGAPEPAMPAADGAGMNTELPPPVAASEPAVAPAAAQDSEHAQEGVEECRSAEPERKAVRGEGHRRPQRPAIGPDKQAVSDNPSAAPKKSAMPAPRPPAGLTGDAARIRAALDRGLGPKAIAAETGMSAKRVGNIMYRHKWRAGAYVPPPPAPSPGAPARMAPTPEPLAFLMSRDYQVLTVPGGYRVDNVVLSPRQLVDKANRLAQRLGKVKTWTVRDLTPSEDAGGASR